MNILAVFPTYRSSLYSGRVGGGEISNRILLEGLVSRGHNVTVCTLNPGPDSDKKINGVEVVSPSNFEKNINRLFNAITYSNLIDSVIAKRTPDVILTGSYGIKSSLTVAKKNKIPVCVFIRSIDNFTGFKGSNNKFKLLVKNFVYGGISPSVLSRADYLIPNSIFVSDVCKLYVPEVKRKIVYPALNVNHISDLKVNNKIKKIYMIGSSYQKGFNIFKYLSSRFTDLEFHVLGSVEPDCKNIFFHGWVDVVKKLSSDADLLLVPSVCEEAFGRVSLEGLISGVPTLVSNVGGLPETVNFEKDLLVESNNKDAWEKALLEFIENPNKVCSATKRAQEKVHLFSLETQLNELEFFLFDVISPGVK